MSLNASMHSRNIYRQRPDFEVMAKTYPSFAAYVKRDLRGKVVFDYNDSHALRELTKTLLKKDFDLEVDIPPDRLIPTVPQRLNYILFVEDLVSKLRQFLVANGNGVHQELITGLDIGTGCCAVFPLIGCALNKNWSFVAIDVDPITIQSAVHNVDKNHLQQRIKGLA
jgi:23S rRNA A1618 N6-methylase RlmF